MASCGKGHQQSSITMYGKGRQINTDLLVEFTNLLLAAVLIRTGQRQTSVRDLLPIAAE